MSDINNPKNKAYLNSALKKLSGKPEDQRVKEFHKRIDKANKQLASNGPAKPKKVSAYHKWGFFCVFYNVNYFIL